MINKRVILLLAVLVILPGFVYAQQEKVAPKKVEIDSNFDGVIDRIEHYNKSGQVVRVETDTNFDGKYDEWVHYKNGKVVKAEKDTNGDGKPDTWMEY